MSFSTPERSWGCKPTTTHGKTNRPFPPSQSSHLSDVDDLGGSVPDAVDAQQLQGLRVEDELEKSVRPPEHLALGELLVVG